MSVYESSNHRDQISLNNEHIILSRSLFSIGHSNKMHFAESHLVRRTITITMSTLISLIFYVVHCTTHLYYDDYFYYWSWMVMGCPFFILLHPSYSVLFFVCCCCCCFFGNFLMSTISSEVKIKWNELKWKQKREMKKRPATGTRCVHKPQHYTKIIRNRKRRCRTKKKFVYGRIQHIQRGKKYLRTTFVELSLAHAHSYQKNWFFFLSVSLSLFHPSSSTLVFLS